VGSPALRGEQFCYHHHATRRPAPRFQGVHPDYSIFELPSIEDRSGVQFAIAQVLARIASNQLDHKRAGHLLHGLFIASHNLPREPRPASARCDSRSSRHSRSDSSSDANESETCVEELIFDDDLGPIAPIAEIPAPPR
jgi:hypothetical protein